MDICHSTLHLQEFMFVSFQIAENIEGVQVECPKPLSLYEQNKNVEMTWSFIVKPKVRFISYS